MARPITLCTGQWADLPLTTLAPMAKSFGFDGLELACFGDHFEVDKALADPNYCGRQRTILEQNGLQLFFEEIVRALNDADYAGPLSVEWEDSGMDREHGAREAVEYVRRLDFAPSRRGR